MLTLRPLPVLRRMQPWLVRSTSQCSRDTSYRRRLVVLLIERLDVQVCHVLEALPRLGVLTAEALRRQRGVGLDPV